MAKISIDLKSGDVKQDASVIVGIDLGTTNSLVSYFKDGQPHMVKQADHQTALVPSIIYFDEGHIALVGTDAFNKLLSDPANTIFSVKRLMGRSYNDISEQKELFSYDIIETDTESLVKIRSGNKFYTPIELSAIILRELKTRTENTLGHPVNQCVITVPAYFNDSQRQATKDAGKLAGWDVLRIVNEPTAAALAYGFDKSEEKGKTIAVYDLGGGTFDISILSLEDGIFEVLSTHGDTWLGGDDFDGLLLNHIVSKLGIDKTNLDKSQVQSLRLESEKAKKALSDQESCEILFEGKKVVIERPDFEDLITPLINRTIEKCQDALKDAGLTIQSISEVILVGGSTRVPAVKQAVKNFFQCPVNDTINPDEVVAQGAAVQADILAGNQSNLLLLDVTPLSLGIETVGGLMDVIIERNSKIPSSAGRNYTTSVDGQVNLKISVFQGERDLVKDNRKLGEFILKNIPPMPAGIPKIEVGFQVDADGILKVRAKELRSDTSAEVTIKAQYGISEEEMALMLIDSIHHAQEDRDSKSLIEARNEGNQILLAYEKFLKHHLHLFSNEQLSELDSEIKQLKSAIKGTDKDAINHSIQEVDRVGRPFAEVAMDYTIRAGLTGKTLA